MNGLLEQINRFRKLKEKVGASKMSSFSVELYFDPDDDDVTVTFGTYDIGDLPRHDILRTSQKRLVKDITFQISIYENIIKKNVLFLGEE